MFPKRNRRSVWLTLGLVATCLVAFSGFAALESDPGRPHLAHSYDNLLRLHVIAHSDMPEDQNVKLLVRDALLAEIAAWPAARERAELEATLLENRARLEAVAESVLRGAGSSHAVRIEVGDFEFPEKRWGAALLPAGEYRAVRVVIGDGAGRNWWCVLFPPLCFVEDELDRVPPGSSEGSLAPVLHGLAWAAGAGEPSGASSAGGTFAPSPGDTAETGQKRAVWRLRLWETLSESAYAGALRSIADAAARWTGGR